MSWETCLETVRRRLVADGCAVTAETLGGTIPVTVGYKSQFKALSRLHVFVVVAAFGHVDEPVVRQFTEDATNLAKVRKGQWRGVQSGVMVLPVLIASEVDPSAVALLRRPYRLQLGGFAASAHPAVVDARSATVYTFRGRRLWGFAFNGLVKKKIATYLADLPVA